MKPFIDPDEIWNLINNIKPDKEQGEGYNCQIARQTQTYTERNSSSYKFVGTELFNEIREGARELKEKVYGNRIVLFAPLYIGINALIIARIAVSGHPILMQSETLPMKKLLKRLSHWKITAKNGLYWSMVNIPIIQS